VKKVLELTNGGAHAVFVTGEYCRIQESKPILELINLTAAQSYPGYVVRIHLPQNCGDQQQAHRSTVSAFLRKACTKLMSILCGFV
jgi:hypothetical protein